METKKSSTVSRLENTSTESVEHLLTDRLPWLVLGLFGGLLATFIMAKYEDLLAADVRLAFFIPIIVYLSDAVGTQTETIYIRATAEKKVNFLKYVLKESLVGFSLGVIFGLCLGLVATYWLHSAAIGFTIGLTMLINLSLAPILAVVIPSLLNKRHTDPALGAGPVATIIQDVISLLIFFFVATMIMFN